MINGIQHGERFKRIEYGDNEIVWVFNYIENGYKYNYAFIEIVAEYSDLGDSKILWFVGYTVPGICESNAIKKGLLKDFVKEIFRVNAKYVVEALKMSPQEFKDYKIQIDRFN